ncbi:intradiol ring-cleavage dioxygenase [Microbacterium flavum]|uniref:Intradiol ring-cleavage dioxygenase n=1 Tax=Microbacterium flavum TaxID=415216 RepID=A0ABS5XTH2_9MICO|nr:intradiol ring-cleavage dioxygenase [Microbacterium flavum]MBT8797832.1 intradiol ring-cleavage dioxygenase [Microbacterium flavum]
MPRIPEPQQTPAGPAYEGRLLDRPDDEVVDQGAGFDIRTLVTRRSVLGLVGLGAGSLALAACSAAASTAASPSATSTATGTPTATPTPTPTPTATATIAAAAGEIPEETNGPYPADGTADVNILSDSGIVRSDITTSLGSATRVAGVPLTMTFKITDVAGGNVPFTGAALYAWHCDAQGLYSMYSSGVEDETYLRGIQIADADGLLTFQTIVPGCYRGRWTHIHFEVYPDAASATDVANVIATSQLAFPPDMLANVYALEAYSGSSENLAGVGTQITDDSLFADGDSSLQVPTITGDAATGYVATLAVAIDTTTQPMAGGGGGGMGGGGGRP